MKCKACGAGPFNGPYQVGEHRREAHPEIVKRELRKKRAGSSRSRSAAPPPESEHDAETELVIASSRVFEDAALDVATNGRVLAYLTARYTIPESE